MLERQAALARLIARMSSDFVGLAPEQTDAAINRALETIGTFAGTDRSYVFLFRDDLRRAGNTHEWCAAGVAPQKERLQDIPAAALSWWMERLQTGKPIVIPSVADLPPEAAAERAFLEAQDVRSLIAVPMMPCGRLAGFLGFDAVRTPHGAGATSTWSC